jgi:hypothetical protein
VVACRDAEAGAVELAPDGIGTVHDPIGIVLHAGRLPQPLRHVFGPGFADRPLEDAPQDAGVERGVVEDGIRRVVAGDRLVGRVVAPAVAIGHERIVVHLCQLRVAAELVDLEPFHAGAHAQQVADGRSVVAGAFHLRQVVGHLVVEALDMAVLKGQANEGGHIGFGHREGQKPRILVAAVAIALMDDVAVLDDDQRIGRRRFERLLED